MHPLKLNNSFVFVAINVVVVGHNPTMQFLEWGYVFRQCVLSANGKYAMVIQCVLPNAVLGP